jgi:zinc transporter ZupT
MFTVSGPSFKWPRAPSHNTLETIVGPSRSAKIFDILFDLFFLRHNFFPFKFLSNFFVIPRKRNQKDETSLMTTMISSKSILLLVLAAVVATTLVSSQKTQQQQVGLSTPNTNTNTNTNRRQESSNGGNISMKKQFVFEWEDTFQKEKEKKSREDRRALQEEEEHDHDHEDEEHDEHSEEEEEEVTASSLKKKPWAEVIIASLLINMATLVGLVVILFTMVGKALMVSNKKKDEGGPPPFAWKFTQNIIPNFACGALMATAVFLILPEAFHLIEAGVSEKIGVEGGGHHDHRRFLQDSNSSNTTATEEDHHEEEEEEHIDTEVPVAWRLGVSIMAGFLTPVVSSLLFPHPDVEPTTGEAAAATQKKDPSDEEDETTGEVEEPVKPEAAAVPKPHAINYSLMSSILLGDFFHNFTDGILVGASFSLCTRSLAISVSAATLYHELAQELGDYFMLTKHCHLTPMVALVCNFVGGMSVLLGAILILLLDVSDLAVGCILALGGGVYLYIAAAECLPRAKLAQTSQVDTLIGLGAFVMGAVPIGLVLLNHEHCTDEH